ncbi:SIS domain-containing protein [Actinoplanes couchii]|uniref:Tagatose-6-phosphate ketose isomerase n=1 Tax=Actinoplanes couchii TaxID=403638 RepID=A0ABQ3XT24_9ACTN|nr:SIS domain-containing protein [Actinoplanes couchii]MDR6319964.1 tagatose-6-phosphate ketose/aldose isomerase [Actinoplanes couchii]GID61654.1 tagatose-6-phosphate ketose isomerase [Actinoplanes couchii]
MSGNDFTRAEINQQPVMWRATQQVTAGLRTEVGRVLGGVLADPRTRIVLTGAGTSAYAGELLAPELSRVLKRQVEAVATTDIVADPQSVAVDDRPVLLVSFARSGNSPESVAAARLVDQLATTAHHLVITCNADGDLAARYRDAGNAVVVNLPAATNDRGFAMTSSFTSMVLAAWLLLAGDADVEALAVAAETVLARTATITATITGLNPDRIVYLGSGALKGLAHEAALKCVELTAGDIVTVGESTLGFRHGPKAALTDGTLAVVFVSGDTYRRAYDLDMARELVASLGPDRVVLIADTEYDVAATHWRVPRPVGLPDGLWAIAAIIPAQLTGLTLSLAGGHTPDNPFPGGEVNRVVQGVTIHPFTDGQA